MAKNKHKCENLCCPEKAGKPCCNFCEKKEECEDACRNSHEKCGLYYYNGKKLEE